MARPVEFDRAAALDAGMRVIWAQGYGGASLEDLLDAMGLSKSSFYQAFGSKQDLLLAAIDHYTTAEIEVLKQRLGQGSFRHNVARLLKDVVAQNNRGCGCLLVNCATEIAPHDEKVSTQVRRGFDRTMTAFEVCIRAAQQRGEISARARPRELARYLVTSIAGLRVMAKAGYSSSAMTRVRNTVLEKLTG